MQNLLTEKKDAVYYLTLNREQRGNSLTPKMIEELEQVFVEIIEDRSLRAVMIDGADNIFCGGADLQWMSQTTSYSEEENYQDAYRLAQLFDHLNSLPLTTIAKVNGAAIGGGLGLVCCCDYVIAAESARFCFSELKLGLLPATILPYVIHTVGIMQTRRLILSARQLDAAQAQQVGLVHEVATGQSLDALADEVLESIMQTAPQAAQKAKYLLTQSYRIAPEQLEQTARLLAEIRHSNESRQGIESFLNHLKPPWVD